MAFKDKLVRCSACGSQFVFTVREQRRLKEQGLPVEPPSFCAECREADVRLAGNTPAPSAAKEEPAAAAPSAPEAKRDTDRDTGRDRGGRSRQRDKPKGRRGDGGGKRKRGTDKRSGKGGGKRRAKPRQTELRIRHMGTVKWFSDQKGYGFIAQDDGDEVFVHTSDIIAPNERSLEEGQPVEYEVEHTPKGLQAVDVVPLA